jgi:hypothetical protein
MKKILLVITFMSFITNYTFSDEGMWPITEIERLNLNEKGLKIPVQQIFNPDGVSLVHGIVRLSGCTASFVSPDGLILTNHHCAFRAVQLASTEQNDYLTNGFLAADRTKEIPAKGYTASIVQSYRDVSEQVLSVIIDGMDPVERTKAIEKRKKELISEAEKDNPGKRAEISEMFFGKTYYLFIYTYLRDVRLVYIPPRGIGEFGGETDNWIWPRHTGDFSFMRAYVAPNGKPAAYSPDNVPFKSIQYFQVEANGVNENDFLFILGFPARTYRHRSSHYVKFEKEVRLPALADWYEWQINLLTDFSDRDPQAALRVASKIKSLANRMKNYRGKLTGLKRLDLVQVRINAEQELQTYIDSDAKRSSIYGDVLPGLKKLYDQQRTVFNRQFVLDQLPLSSILLNNARFALKTAENLQKPDLERESAYMTRNFTRTRRRVFQQIGNFHPESEKIILKEVLKYANQLSKTDRLEPLDIYVFKDIAEDDIDRFIDDLYKRSQFSNSEFMQQILEMTPEAVSNIEDPALDLMTALLPIYDENRDERRRFEGTLTSLHSKLLDIKKEFLAQSFVPDANRSLRLTYGYVRGYQPRDAVSYYPITFFKGVVEKTTQYKPFVTPPDLLRLHQSKNFGKFKHPEINDVPVAILYNTDTSGGNSGSPILNASGDLVGVNFDRAWEATINDYAWSESYSRSIGVDIRYILWVTQKFAGADYLLREMNVIQ